MIDSFEDIFQAIRKSAILIGLEPPDKAVLQGLMHYKLEEIIETLYPTPEKRLELIDQFKRIYDSSGYPGTILYPQVISTLSNMKIEGKKLFLVTNKRWSATVALISKFALENEFEVVITSDCRKRQNITKGEMLWALIEEHSLDREVSVYVGDTRGDLIAAHEAGIDFILATYGYGDGELLCNADERLVVINNISELSKGKYTFRK